MLCENSKILLDYKSERTVTKQSVRFTVLRSKAVSRLICDKQDQPQLVNYMSTTRQWDFKIQCFGRQYTDFSRPCKGAKHGSSYGG